jgi:hypothetical protein
MKLEDLKNLCAQATPAPWEPNYYFIGFDTLFVEGEEFVGCAPATNKDQADKDAAFISAARTMLPKLIAVAEAAQFALEHALWLDERSAVYASAVYALEGSARAKIRAALVAMEAE